MFVHHAFFIGLRHFVAPAFVLLFLPFTMFTASRYQLLSLKTAPAFARFASYGVVNKLEIGFDAGAKRKRTQGASGVLKDTRRSSGAATESVKNPRSDLNRQPPD